MFHQFRAGEHGLLEIVAKFQSAVRARRYAELAENAAAQVVDIIVEHAFGIARFVGNFFGDDLYRVVGTVHLADAAGDALMIAVGIVFQRQGGSEPVGDFQGRSVFGIFFRNFRGNKFLARYLHTHEQAPKTFPKCDEIVFYTFHKGDRVFFLE